MGNLFSVTRVGHQVLWRVTASVAACAARLYYDDKNLILGIAWLWRQEKPLL